MISLNKLM